MIGTILAMGGSAQAGRAPQASGKGHAVHVAAPGVVLYDQNSNDSGVGIVSQNFETSFDIYDAAGADDFKVPSGHKWKITSVTVTGVYFNGSGPARNETVTIYKDAGGLPGAQIKAKTKTGTDNFGSFVIKLGKKGIIAPAGTNWVSVVANMDFSSGGEWGWETGLTQNGNPAAWQNPGDGFGSGCTTWGNMNSCIGALGEGPDFMFALGGKQK